MKVWVVTYQVNEYDQMDDGYFHAVFKNKPTDEQLKSIGVDHLGRKDYEYQWYSLDEVKVF